MSRGEVLSEIELAVREYNQNLYQTLGGMTVPGMKYPIDPWLFAMIMGSKIAMSTPDEVDEMRSWSLDRWAAEIDTEIERQALSLGVDPVGIEEPGVAPPWLTPLEANSYRQAHSRAGELIVGLGNYAEESTGEIVAEAWDKNQLEFDADAEARKRNLSLLSEELKEVIARGGTAEEVALNMGRLTGDWGRNWLRIARTELQGAHNEGAAIEALEVFGPQAKVARVPDVTACPDCRRLFLDGGTPKVFLVSTLVDNGTNAGRKAKDWKPTLWPVHPNCRCSVQVVPPGMAMSEEWDLVDIGDVAA